MKYPPGTLVTAAPAGPDAVFRVAAPPTHGGRYRLDPVNDAAEAYAGAHKRLHHRGHVELHSRWLIPEPRQDGGRA